MTFTLGRWSSIAVLLFLSFSILFHNGVDGMGWKPAAIGAGCAAAYGVLCLKEVTTGNEVLVERFGKFHKRLGPGWHFLLRPFDSISFSTTLREQVFDIPPQQCITKDNAPIKADAVIFLRIEDAWKARYAVSELRLSIMNLCLTQLREQIGKLTMDETFSSRNVINTALLKEINDVCREWGVVITRVEIQNLKPSYDILQAMESQLAADRHKRAAILKSEGERTALENASQGKAFAMVTEAKARQESIHALAQAEAERDRLHARGMSDALLQLARCIHDNNDENTGKTKSVDAALQLLLMNRYMEAQEKIATSDSSKVFMFPTKDSVPITYPALEQIFRN